jgi:transposase InsO family protein
LEGRNFESLEEAQAALDAWVEHYNTERPHQGIGMVPPLLVSSWPSPSPWS